MWSETSGSPALTATSLALVWRAAFAFPLTVVVVVVLTLDCDDTGLWLLPDRRKAIRTTTAAIATTIPMLRYSWRRFFAWRSASSRASLAAR